jgi:elongation factor 1-gamma
MKLFTYPDRPTLCHKILAAAKLAGVSVEVAAADANSASNSPSGKLPFLETGDGVVFEANAIARYVSSLGANKATLLGATPADAGLVDSWIEYASVEIELPAAVWAFPTLGLAPSDAAATSKAKGDVRKVFDVLNKYLATRTFLVGERLSLADVSVACSLLDLYTQVLDPGFRKAFANVNRWFLTVINQPAIQSVFGNVRLAEKAAAPVEKPVAEEKPKAEKPKKEEKPKAEKPKKEEKPPKDEEEEEENEFDDDKPKGKNPLDLLPPTTMNMDEWKRTYSNNDTRPVAMPWFWEHLDASGYSLWWCRYKYNSELDVGYRTANLIGGWFQRLDKLRKYGFGSVIIFGVDPTLEIEGAWLVRGKVIPPELTEGDDFALYDWKEFNLSNEAEKKLLEDFWAWDGDFAARADVWGGQPKATAFNQGKVFK